MTAPLPPARIAPAGRWAPFIGSKTVTRTFYVSAAGSDSNTGTTTGSAWQTITKVNAQTLAPGDTILFRGGDTFSDAMLYLQYAGTPQLPITIGSYGTGRATISATSGNGIYVYAVGGIMVRDLILSGNTGGDGLGFYKDTTGLADNIRVFNVDASGWANGISVGGANGGGFSNVTISGGVLSSNRDAGLNIFGPTFNSGAPAYAHTNVQVVGVTAHDNLGNSSNTTTNSGNGIVLGSVSTGLVDLCTAYSNGANNASTAEGPAGIWAYNSTGMTIQRSLSYNNTSGTVIDGDGFDLDINTSNSTVQYCLAYGNKGPGILLFGNTGNTAHTGNTVRYNLCWGNAQNSAATFGEINIYGGVNNDNVYNNTVVARDFGAILPPAIFCFTGMTGNTVRNNILVSQSGPVVFDATADASTKVLFQGNAYYSTNSGALASWGGTSYTTLAAWRAAITGQEVVSAANTGTVGDPGLINVAAAPTTADPRNTSGTPGLVLGGGSALTYTGLDLAALFGTTVGIIDYFGTPLTSPYSVGAAEVANTGTPDAAAAAGSAAAGAPTATITPAVAAASAAGAANPATVAVAPLPPTATAVGAANTATPNTPITGIATAVGAANTATPNVQANPAAATGTGQALSADALGVPAGHTHIRTTIHPDIPINVDDAELESLTRQGLVVGVSAPPRPTSAPDTITAHVRTTLNPQVLIGVGAAEFESLTRQGLIYSVGSGYGTGGYGTSGYGD